MFSQCQTLLSYLTISGVKAVNHHLFPRIMAFDEMVCVFVFNLVLNPGIGSGILNNFCSMDLNAEERKTWFLCGGVQPCLT